MPLLIIVDARVGVTTKATLPYICRPKFRNRDVRTTSRFVLYSVIFVQEYIVLNQYLVEGFLIRLTSGKGRDRRLGRLFYKRMYFHTHNNLLCFCKPALASPPPPPRLSPKRGNKVPTSDEIIGEIPLVYAVAPFALQEGNIEWVSNGNVTFQEGKDAEAYAEAKRSVHSLLHMEGFVDLTKVDRIRPLRKENLDENLGEGEDVDFHQEVSNTNEEDGVIESLDDDRTLEVILKNGLTLKLQASILYKSD